MAGVEDVMRLHDMVAAARQREIDALLNDPKLKYGRARVVKADNYLHLFNVWTWVLWVVAFDLVLTTSHNAIGLLFGLIPVWWGVRVFRMLREDWRGIVQEFRADFGGR